MLNAILALVRRIRTSLAVAGKSRFLEYGKGLHVGARSRLWAPDNLTIGDNVYIGKDIHIECNCHIGNFVLIANRVAFVGRHDHDFRAVGFPVRFSPWIASARFPSPWRAEMVTIEDDVWIGCGAVLLTGITVGRGAIVGAGTLVSHDVAPYSIVLGSPARVVGTRFSTREQIDAHEYAIQHGRFAFSERGYDHCVIEPARIQPTADRINEIQT